MYMYYCIATTQEQGQAITLIFLLRCSALLCSVLCLHFALPSLCYGHGFILHEQATNQPKHLQRLFISIYIILIRYKLLTDCMLYYISTALLEYIDLMNICFRYLHKLCASPYKATVVASNVCYIRILGCPVLLLETSLYFLGQHIRSYTVRV